MNVDTFVEQLNEMGECTCDGLLVRARARQSVETRLAAVLMIVAGSDLEIAPIALEIIMDLTLPEWESDYEDPLLTPIGKGIADLTRNPEMRRMKIDQAGQLLATRLIKLAANPAAVTDSSTDTMLRIATNKDMAWWLDWIRQNRVD